MGQRDILLLLAGLFRRFKLDYLLTGSFAVSYYGVPRATHDIDFIIEITPDSRDKLYRVLKQLEDTFIFNPVTFSELTKRKQIDLVHEESGIKVDFWIIPRGEFRIKFARKNEMLLDKTYIQLISPEDLILNKLKWCKQVFSERHFMDCVGIIKIQEKRLDTQYLQTKINKLDLQKLYNDVNQWVSKK